jgi:uncharacterized protein (DUF2062 family)
MNKRNLAMLFGFLSALVPFFGLPRGYAAALSVMLGLAVVVACLPVKLHGNVSKPSIKPSEDVSPKA